MTTSHPLLLLAPSSGFIGGIERVAAAIEGAWPGGTRRIALYDARRHATAEGRPAAKLVFAARACAAGASARHHAIVCLHIGLMPVAVAVARISRRPLWLVAHGTEVWAPLPAPTRRAARQAAGVLAVSSFTAEWTARRTGLSPERVHVVQLPLPAPLAAVAARPAAPMPTEPRFITVARIERQHRYKGHFVIADALPAVLARVPAARWVVVGDGDDLPALRDHVRAVGVADAVDFLGAVSDTELAAAYASSRCLVLPSPADVDARPPTGEGFGIVYVEAAAHGRPAVAAAKGGGSADFVVDGETGRIAVGRDPDGLASVIVELLTDAELAARLGAAARERALRRHLPEHFAARVCELLGADG